MNCKLGYMKVNENYRVGSLPYEIMAYTHEKEEKTLIKSQDTQNVIGYISRFHIGNQLDLYLNDEQGEWLRTYHFAYDTSKFEKTTQKEIDEDYAGTVIQEETDIILEGEMKFFVWVSKERWGFVVLPILFAYSWRLTVLVLLFSGLSALIIFLAMGPFRQRLQDLYATEGERQAFLVENIRAMPTVKSLSLEPLRRRGWDNRAAVATGMRFRVGKMSIAISTFMQVMQKCMTLAIIWWGVYQVFDNTMTVGALVAFNMYSARVTGPLVQIAGLIQQYQETGISMRMLAQVMDEPPEDGGARGVLPRINGAIRCRNLTFRYTKDGAPALSDVSFDCPAGSVLGVVGRSGSGKSTLTRLIQRLQPLQEGDIWIDNHNIRDIDMAHLRRSIGVVLQENFLFRGRVRDNIAMTRPTATLEEIVHAARMAAAHEFIEKLPEGYNTVLEEGGSNLSGGQRQRLAIARALLTDPKLMIFDEATSALDPESEAEIQGNINTIGRGRTMIIVSHRLSMLRHADQILVLDGGRLVGAGAHEDVYANCPIYRSLWDRQNAVQQGAL